jgi:PAS domain S-box-containing protein
MSELQGPQSAQSTYRPVDGGTCFGDEPYRLLVQETRDYAVFMLDRNGHILTWNAGAERIKGYSAEEIVGRHFSIFYPPDSPDPSRELDVAARSGRFEDEGWRVRKDGSLFWASVTINALHGKSGTLVGFSKITRDLTEKKAAEIALRESQQVTARLSSVLAASMAHLQNIVNASDRVAMIATDEGGMITMFNHGAEKVFGYASSEVVGKLTALAFLTETREPPAPKPADERPLHCIEVLLNSMREHCSEHVRHPYRRKDGNQIFVSRSVSSIHDEVGIEIGFLIIAIDVSEQCALERRLEQERQLKEMRIEALSNMAGGISHEISNPLAIMHLLAETLELQTETGEPLIPADVRQVCRQILENSNRAQAVLRGLKGLAQNGAKDPMKDVSIHSLVHDCVLLNRNRFDQHRIALAIRIPEELPPLHCRPAQIGQILTNLLSNAFDAVSPSEIPDRWVCLSVFEDRAHIVFEVSDSGSGIPEEVQKNLMEPFFTTKQTGGGIGIGLSVSKAIAEDHGGSLVLATDSTATRFRLSLPSTTSLLAIHEAQPT